MKILYDHQAFLQQYGGVSRSFTQLIKNLNVEVEKEVSIVFSRNQYIREIFPQMNYPFGNFYIPFKRRILYRINLKNSIKKIIQNDFDLFHPTADDAYFLKYLKRKFVITIHDLIPESESDKWPSSWLVNRALLIEKSSHIIAVSNQTKFDLLKFYPHILSNKISVIYHGYDKKISQDINDNTLKINYKFFLYVGLREGYKNFEFLIKSISSFLLKERLILVCVGNSFTPYEIEMFEKEGIKNNIISVRVNDDELAIYYQKAEFLIFPSLKEGFGIPILEAWSNHCPVLLNDIDVFREIAADAALFFRNNSKDLLEKVEFLYNNFEYKQKLIQTGLSRLELFNWKKSAEELIKVYQGVLEKQNND